MIQRPSRRNKRRMFIFRVEPLLHLCLNNHQLLQFYLIIVLEKVIILTEDSISGDSISGDSIWGFLISNANEEEQNLTSFPSQLLGVPYRNFRFWTCDDTSGAFPCCYGCSSVVQRLLKKRQVDSTSDVPLEWRTQNGLLMKTSKKNRPTPRHYYQPLFHWFLMPFFILR